MRWSPAELGPTGPAEFIPVAERTGLIRAIDRIAWGQPMGQLEAWRVEGMETPAQPAWLMRNDCTVGQGYLCSKPVEADRFAEILAKVSMLR